MSKNVSLEDFNVDGDERATALMSRHDFAQLGEGLVAYVRPVSGEQALQLFPALDGLPEGIDLFAVVGADGTPLALADSAASAAANAIENDLQPVNVH